MIRSVIVEIGSDLDQAGRQRSPRHSADSNPSRLRQGETSPDRHRRNRETERKRPSGLYPRLCARCPFGHGRRGSLDHPTRSTRRAHRSRPRHAGCVLAATRACSVKAAERRGNSPPTGGAGFGCGRSARRRVR
jgi:hypothetical protein